MAATVPRPPRPLYGPPTTALPPLPTTRSRKSTGAIPTYSSTHVSVHTPLPKSGLRLPSTTASTSSPATTTLSRLSTTPGFNNAGKTVRKTISVGAFPQPPRGIRLSSLPPSPLSGGVIPLSPSSTSDESREKSMVHPPPGALPLRRRNISINPDAQTLSGRSVPSVLPEVGEESSRLGEPGARGSDGLLSLPSPPQSRTSSARDSYSTSATIYEDAGNERDVQPVEASGSETRRGRNTSRETQDDDKEGEGKGNVVVSVRVRPDNDSIADRSKNDGEWMVDSRRGLVAFKGREGGSYYYDNVFATHDNNARVYDSLAKRLVRRVMQGYHGTVFAYGMTGTGKTFSMQGTASSPGVIPLAITDIFSYIRETPSREFLLRVSYLEIYNERIHDLLSAPGTTQQEEIKLREDPKRGVYASPLKEEIVQSPTQLLRVIARGDHARRTSSTQFNARSSRSHAVVQIVVESRERIPGTGAMSEDKSSAVLPSGVRVSTLSLIDLAGSERAAETKERRTEGSHINKSLLTLGTVIAKLSGDKDKDGKQMDTDGKHLPYRDSKLTRLLQGALSGNSLVSILCTIQIKSPGNTAASNSHTGETLNTLKFASRAKNNIVSHAKQAEEALGQGGDGGARVLLERYRLEIQDLRGQLDDQARTKDEDDEKEREKEAEIRREEQMLEMQLARTALKERIEHLNRLILSSKSTGVNSAGSLSSLSIHPRLSAMTSNSQSGVVSTRQLMTKSEASARKSADRTASVASLSTVGQPQAGRQHSEELSPSEDSAGEFGDGNASLVAQNQALQADLADKNRYISTLEKRLLQARRSSHSRTSMGFSSSKAAIMVGEDHGVSVLLKDKDSEIAELRAQLDDKDRMLTALRSAARSRDIAERAGTPRASSLSSADGKVLSRSSSIRDPASSPLTSPHVFSPLSSPKVRKPNRSVDEVNCMLDEMLEDKVQSGHLVRGSRGSVRVVSDRKSDPTSVQPTVPEIPPLASPALTSNDMSPVFAEA